MSSKADPARIRLTGEVLADAEGGWRVGRSPLLSIGSAGGPVEEGLPGCRMDLLFFLGTPSIGWKKEVMRGRVLEGSEVSRVRFRDPLFDEAGLRLRRAHAPERFGIGAGPTSFPWRALVPMVCRLRAALAIVRSSWCNSLVPCRKLFSASGGYAAERA